jgi:hypothetical protein
VIGFSLWTLLGLLIALPLILYVAPASVKKVAEQIISLQVGFSGGYLTMVFGLFNIIIYTWLYPNGLLYPGWAPELFISLWSGIVGCLIGAVYWVFLCLYFIEKIQSKLNLLFLILYPIFMLFQHYLPNLYGIGVNQTEILALKSPVTDWISTVLILIAVTVLSVLYFKNKSKWVKL